MVMYGIQQPPALIGEIVKGSPAERAGLMFGDEIKAIDGKEVRSWKDVQRLIGERPKQNMQLRLARKGQTLDLTLAPEAVQDEDMPGTRGRIGISRFMVPSVVTRMNAEGFFSLAGIQTGDRLVKVKWADQVFEIQYWRQFLNFMQILSDKQKAALEPASLEVTVESFVPETEEKEAKKPEKAAQRVVAVQVPPAWSLDSANLSESTGITHGQLTVYQSEPPVEGLERGDLILKWNDKPLATTFDLSQELSQYRQARAKLTVFRGGKELEIEVALKGVEVQKVEGKATAYTLPVMFWGTLEQPEWIIEQYKNPLQALAYGFTESLDLTKSIGRAIGGLFTGEMPLSTLGGPIAIAKVASDSVRIGWQAFANALALISINLALLNLVPIPVLDGGQIAIVGAEAVLRRPVREVTIENYQKIGFVMVLALFVIATYNDLGRFWASMLRGVSTMF